MSVLPVSTRRARDLDASTVINSVLFVKCDHASLACLGECLILVLFDDAYDRIVNKNRVFRSVCE